MPEFLYKAVDPSGAFTQGQLEAVNDIDLEQRLKRMGLDLITYREASTRTSLFGGSAITPKDLILFCFHMEQLTRAGVPIIEGMNDLRDSISNPGFKRVISQVIKKVEGGLMLSEAMALHPKVFDHVTTSLVNAGEKTGELALVFDHLAETLKWQDELVAQTRKLLAYPLIILIVVLGATGFLMIYLVPQMVSFIISMGQEIPLQTRIMISVSDFLIAWWWLLLLVPVIVTVTLAGMIRKSPVARYRFDFVKLHLPITGAVLHKIILARFARYLGLMYQTGIPILDAIKSCQDIVDNRVLAEGLERVWQQINAGERMSESFNHLGLFPPLVVRMIRIGESTGTLDRSLLNINYFYDREVKDSVEKILKMIEPVLTIILGSLLAMIMFSVLGPVYDTLSQMKL